jgi:hypothetical protein
MVPPLNNQIAREAMPDLGRVPMSDPLPRWQEAMAIKSSLRVEKLICFLVLAVVKINQLKCVRILRGIYKNYRKVEKGGGGCFFL